MQQVLNPHTKPDHTACVVSAVLVFTSVSNQFLFTDEVSSLVKRPEQLIQPTCTPQTLTNALQPSRSDALPDLGKLTAHTLNATGATPVGRKQTRGEAREPVGPHWLHRLRPPVQVLPLLSVVRPQRACACLAFPTFASVSVAFHLCILQ